jgi:hypothetical protein
MTTARETARAEVEAEMRAEAMERQERYARRRAAIAESELEAARHIDVARV